MKLTSIENHLTRVFENPHEDIRKSTRGYLINHERLTGIYAVCAVMRINLEDIDFRFGILKCFYNVNICIVS